MTDWAEKFPTATWCSADGSALLYCGDCLTLLPRFPAGSSDAVKE